MLPRVEKTSVLNYSSIVEKTMPSASKISANSSGISSLSNEIKAVTNTDQTLNAKKNESRQGGFGQFVRQLLRIKNAESTSSDTSKLIGKTISPKIATSYQSIVSFDGTGKIIGFKKELSASKFNVLINNCIPSLNETPQLSGDKIRSPGECVIDIAIALDRAMPSGYFKDETQAILKKTWLDGGLSRQALTNVVELIKMKMKLRVPELASKLTQQIDSICNTLEKEQYQTKRNDNFYGRIFETHLSEYLIRNPDSAMLEVRDTVASAILDDFTSFWFSNEFTDQVKSNICEQLVSCMEADPPSWRYDIESVKKFLASKKPADFIDMIKFQGEFSVPLVLSTAVKYITIAPGLLGLKEKASEFYVNKILPQRNLIKTSNIEIEQKQKSNFYGLMLPYQRGANAGYAMNAGIGIRPIDRYLPPSVEDGMSEHDLVAASNERTIGIGMSGSANLLNFLFNKMQETSSKFPMDTGRLAAASWLTYSGGHSFNEAYSVFSYNNGGSFKPLSFKSLAETYDLMGKGVEHAYNQVLQTAQHLQPTDQKDHRL